MDAHPTREKGEMSITAYLELERDEVLDSVLLAMADSDAGRNPRALRSRLPEIAANITRKIKARPGKILSRPQTLSSADQQTVAPARRAAPTPVKKSVATPVEKTRAPETVREPVSEPSIERREIAEPPTAVNRQAATPDASAELRGFADEPVTPPIPGNAEPREEPVLTYVPEPVAPQRQAPTGTRNATVGQTADTLKTPLPQLKSGLRSNRNRRVKTFTRKKSRHHRSYQEQTHHGRNTGLRMSSRSARPESNWKLVFMNTAIVLTCMLIVWFSLNQI